MDRARPLPLPLPLVLVCAALAAPRALAADPPKFEFGKAEEIKVPVEWKASAQLGLIATTGNSETITLSGGLSASRNDGKNKVALDVNGAFGRSDVLVADPKNGDTTVAGPGDIDVQHKLTAGNVLGKLRYDRFFTTNNSGYVTAYVGLDQPAGKDFIAGAQAGYARQIVHTPRHLLSGEVGYDYVYFDFITPVGSSTMLHSARLFLGYTLTLNDTTAIAASVEAMINGNPVDVANVHYGFAEASRVVGKASLTTRLWKNLAFRFSFTARFDNAPAAQPALSIPYSANFLPLADKLDTLSEASLVVTFL